jgi:hypothetical protein
MDFLGQQLVAVAIGGPDADRWLGREIHGVDERRIGE